MKKITREMIKLYPAISGLDWLNYKLVKKDLTAHHIVKKEEGGKLERSNIALLLMPVSHQYLHLIEYKDFETYVAINKIFSYVNQQGYEPTREQREILEYMLQEFESEHRNDKNSKGKRLIQAKYLKRG